MAQSVKCLPLDFCSGHDLTVCEFEPHVRLHADGTEPAWDSQFPSVSVPSLLSLKNKQTLKKIKVACQGCLAGSVRRACES